MHQTTPYESNNDAIVDDAIADGDDAIVNDAIGG